MIVIDIIVGKLLYPLVEHFFSSVGHHIGYLVHYKKHIKDLEHEIEKLRGERGRNQGAVSRAMDSAEVIEEDVLNWLKKVDETEEDVKKLMDDRERIKCLGVCLMYRLGREGRKKMKVVSKLLEDGIFDTVGHPAPIMDIWYTSTTDYEGFESRELVFKEIMEALKDDESYKIGVYGMPGVGKTRMVEEVAKQAKKEKLFDEVAKTVISENPDLKSIQEELADCLNMTFNKETQGGRKGQLHNRLKNGNKILVIIDDVWNDQIKLEEIGIPSTGDQTKGCKIVLTSRRDEMCKEMEVEKNFPIGLLSEAEAWSLFKKTVGDSTESPEMHSVAEKVCRECDRLPLAILTVGAALKDENKHAWDDAIEQLRNSKGGNIEGVTTKLYSRIELSYRYLEQADERSCFLHCCLFREDAEISIDDLLRYGVGTRFLQGMNTLKKARDRTRVLVETLKKSYLLLEGKNENFFKMHDVIRHVAISIASREEHAFLVKTGVQEWPEEDEYKCCSSISLRSKNIRELPRNLKCPELLTLVLECNNPSVLEVPKVPISFFKGMEKLEVLDLCNMRVLTLPSSLKNLRMLRLVDCQLVNLAFVKELKNLEILSVSDFDLKELAQGIGQLTRLRLLDLRNCYNVKILPSGIISSLSRLEELYIPCYFKRWGVQGNASLVELNSLLSLVILEIHIPNDMLLPKERLFESLIRFKISIGSGFYPEENYSATRILKLEGITLKRELNMLIVKAEVLYLTGLEGLKNVLDYRDGKGFLDLKYLKVEDCDEMEHLFKPKWNAHTKGPSASGSFSKLTVLRIQNCRLKYLFSPSIARGLRQLQELKISKCMSMEEVVKDGEEVVDKIIFRQLKNMELENLPNLRSIYANNMKKKSTTECRSSTLAQALFNDKVVFPALEQLNISSLGTITAIWDNQSLLVNEAEDSFWRLRYMEVCQCDKLVNVIPSNLLPRLQNLEMLEVKWCESVVCEVEVLTIEKGSTTSAPTIVLPRIGAMHLGMLPNLMHMGLNKKVLSDSPHVYENLSVLFIDNCNSVRNVFSPSIAKNLVHFQELEVTACKKMEEIVAVETGQGENSEEDLADDEILIFPQLKTLTLEYLPKLKSFCCSYRSKRGGQENERGKETLPIVEALFNDKVKFPALEELTVTELKSLRVIWKIKLFQGSEAEDSFRKVRLIEVYGCQKLVNVIPSNVLPRLQNLEKLDVDSCASVVSVVEVLNVEEGCATSAPTIILPRLRELKLYSLPNLRRTGLYQKQYLDVYHSYSDLTIVDFFACDRLRNVFSLSIVRNLCQLRELRIERCWKMEEIVVIEKRQEEEEETDDEILVFPQLRIMTLQMLPELRNFYCNCGSKEEEQTEEDSIPEWRALFNQKVKFPCLEVLRIKDMKNFKEIWHSTVPTDSVPKLRFLQVKRCGELLNVASSRLLGSFENLEELKVQLCRFLEEIFKIEGSNATAGVDGRDEGVRNEVEDDLLLPRLKRVALEDLPCLSCFCISKLPSLVTMSIERCPKLEMLPRNTSTL
ncbi:probable disease resistance protein At4g27220 [Cornus florida]|uniref:probable disease resistance protein At4g27220 n=1 Tax=Cornus florida TaxID=4283 RepID=UPI0028980D82|nr:probable disease resistance protein At4g27220 [Cornus florida]